MCSSGKKTQFFKIILKSTMHEGKLEIPRKFVIENENDLSECVTLEVPDGAQWQIKLTKTQDGKVCMQQGWLDFANHYSLSFGNLLVFNPQGLSKFLVVIFDMTGTEIKYAPISENSRKGHSERESKLRKKDEVGENSPLPVAAHRSYKRKRVNNSDSCRSESSADAECDMWRSKKARADAGLRSPTEELNGGYTSRTQKYQSKAGRKKKYFRATEKAKMLERTRDFYSSKPYFKIVIQPSAVFRKDKMATLYLPSGVSKKYFAQTNGDIILQDKEGRTWSVNYSCAVIGGHSRGKLVRGWKEFSVDNNLVVGDVCVFEKIKDRVTTFNVVIFRARKSISSIPTHQPNEGGNGQTLSCEQKVNLLGEVREFKSTKPYFKVIIQSSAVHGSTNPILNVPAKFAKKYLTSKKGDVVIQDLNCRTWFITYYWNVTRSTSQARFGGGWKQFARDNDLKVGDVCVFEMKNSRNITFEVIFLKEKTANCFSSSGNSSRLENEKTGGGDISVRRSCPELQKEANKSTRFNNDVNRNMMTTYSKCTAELNYTSVELWRLNVPTSFAEKYIKTGASTIILNVGDKSWRVKLFKYQDGTCKICAGWIAFIKENSLKPMDICNFELIKRNDCVFRVSICRNTK